MGKVKELEQFPKQQLPKALSDRLIAERDSANAQIERINTSFQKTVSLLFEGFATSLDPKKSYTLSSDLKTFVEL